MPIVSAENSEYEDRARKEIEVWRGKQPSRVIRVLGKPGEFLGYPIRKALETERGRKILEKVVGSLFDAGTWRLESDKILKTYRDKGYDVQRLAHIPTQVSLQDRDHEAKKHWMAATATLAVEGSIVGPALAIAATAAGAAAATAAVASGGTAGPAAAAAGLAVVGSATIVETTFLIAFCCRRIASIAACYGYDVADDRERAFALQVLSVATAQTSRPRRSLSPTSAISRDDSGSRSSLGTSSRTGASSPEPSASSPRRSAGRSRRLSSAAFSPSSGP
jgi:hypothetical protein